MGAKLPLKKGLVAVVVVIVWGWEDVESATLLLTNIAENEL
jgi:hypothetical protein